jgi:hypothetical protein
MAKGVRLMTDNYIIGWRIWYDDGLTYNSREHAWKDVPDDGVLCRMLYFKDGSRQIQQNYDFYFEAPHSSGIIYGAGDHKDDIPKRYPDAEIKRGRWAPLGFYYTIVRQAMEALTL